MSIEGKKTPSVSSKKKSEDKKINDSSYTFRFRYTTFDDLKEQGEYNFYGIIFDATFPREEDVSKMLPNQKHHAKYSCFIKLIDQSTNCLTNPNNFLENIITLIIQSNEKENIPYIHHIGDIIRVHRGLYSPKKNRNVYVNFLTETKTKCAWSLYPLSSGNDPYLCSNKKYIYENQDKQNIEKMRNWAKNYLGIENSLIYEKTNNVDNRVSEDGNRDLLVQIVKKVELDDQIVFFILDDTDGCELHTYKYFDFLKENDVIRIRGYKIFDTDNLVLNEEGNILIVPTNSNCYKDFMNRITKKLKEIQK